MHHTILSFMFLFLSFGSYVSYAKEVKTEPLSIHNFITEPKDDLTTRVVICSLIAGVYTLYWFKQKV
jgi:hypothetical protein